MALKRYFIVATVVLSTIASTLYADTGEELKSAVSKNDCNKVAELLGKGANPDTLFEDFTSKVELPVIFMSFPKSVCLQYELARAGADIDYQVLYKDKDGNKFYITPLSGAIRFMIPSQVETLLKLGANQKIQDKNGSNLVDIALKDIKRRRSRSNSGNVQEIIDLLEKY
ncbi:hypothetical protein [Amphritea pacifica]|uniref:Ankyrin repeat domain-containing protein n=1 Tax=Amphritea pacifica TaxID=2811233 RepID=A0ABS2WEQ7_9GAMM|nr:hypothetical protein [Amphritea pacifica]MBN0989902.1 hypothetical protein [Amphritea pacifica]